MLRKSGNQSLRGISRFGLGVAIFLTLAITLIVAVGNVAIILFTIGTGLAIGAGMLIGTLLCELVNRRNK